ncbi:hypothetical protein [Paraburkholderia caffeinilytica]|uniref:hypothetical protein n=1 Tax=Paraburkholderia caffeinilytica TaxID=1761016 RepID=UPI003DA15144
MSSSEVGGGPQRFGDGKSLPRESVNALNAALANVPQYSRCLSSTIPIHLRWYVSNLLTWRALKEMLSEDGISIDHSTSRCRTCELLSLLGMGSCYRTRAVGGGLGSRRILPRTDAD